MQSQSETYENNGKIFIDSSDLRELYFNIADKKNNCEPIPNGPIYCQNLCL